jgi:hypothetical protein
MAQTSRQLLAANFREIGTLERHVRKTFLQIGKCLSRVRDLCAEERASFQAELEKHGLGYRKSLYLIEIYELSAARNFDRKRLLAIGWSKASIIMSLFGKGDDEKVFALAEANNQVELRHHVSGDPPTEKLTTIVFTLSDADRAYLDQQLMRDGARRTGGRGYVGRDAALMRLARRGATKRAAA